MIASLFNTLIHEPLYNALIFVLNHVPHADVGIAVIVLTIVVKLVLFPLTRKASHTQARVRDIMPLVENIKEKYKDNKQEQTLKIMALYKEHGIKVSASFITLIIQLPVIFGLYLIFYKGGLPIVETATLYSFVHVPEIIDMHFLGLVDMAGRSVFLAILAGVTQFLYSSMVMHAPKPRGENPTLKEDFAHSMHLQMKFVMPIIIAGVAYFISSAVALYWCTSNLFMIAQEYIVRFERRAHASSAHNTMA